MTILLNPPALKWRCVEQLDRVDPDLVERFLKLYRAAFAPLETLAPARQSLTDAEFREHMADESVIKFVAWNDDGEPVALAFMATDLASVPWISLPYFAVRFPEHFARGAIYYFGALLVDSHHAGGPWASMLVRAAAGAVAAAGAIAVFDCCDHNVSRKLPELVARAAAGVAAFDRQELAAQRYFACIPKDLPFDESFFGERQFD